MVDKKSIVSGIRKKKMGLDEKLKAGEATVEKLGQTDTYPIFGNYESDTQAQDGGFGNGSLDNQSGSEDQDEVRKKANRVQAIFAKIQQKHTGR